MRRGTRRGQQAILLLGFLAAMCATNAQAQIGCSTRSEPPGTKSIACGVRSAHRMGAADASRYGYGGGSYGRGSYSSSSAGEASEILPYLSPGCAELNDAMRTGPSRGVHGDVLSQLQREYRTKCGDEESLAYQRLRDEQSNQRGAAVQARQAQAGGWHERGREGRSATLRRGLSDALPALKAWAGISSGWIPHRHCRR